jgi:LmbE family N-acetylglucosaminyl deacetylase
MGPEETPWLEARVMIVAAHPDDEVIGAGGQFPDLAPGLLIVHVTDGAPLNPADAEAAGFSSRQDYAAARHHESTMAGALAGVDSSQYVRIGVTDQRAGFDLEGLTKTLADLFERERPDIVLTHPYEGGHPDHDATAFAVHAAAHLSGVERLWEFTSYHSGERGLVTGQFLANGPGLANERALTEERRDLKRRMFDCFATQQHMLVNFGTEVERFRQAPHYDFTRAPHPGRLNYENFDWGMTGMRFRENASRALDGLGMKLNVTNDS